MTWIDTLSSHRILSHITNMAPGVALAALLYLCVLPWRRRRLAARSLQSSAVRECALLLFLLFCGGMAAITLTPRWFHWLSVLAYGYPGHPIFSMGTVNLIPFQTFALDLRYVILGNILLFMPFCFFPALLWQGFGWKKALLTGFCVTAFIECWQLMVGRAFDIDDLLLNTFGAFCGWLLALAARRLFPHFTGKLLPSPATPS